MYKKTRSQERHKPEAGKCIRRVCEPEAMLETTCPGWEWYSILSTMTRLQNYRSGVRRREVVHLRADVSGDVSP